MGGKCDRLKEKNKKKMDSRLQDSFLCCYKCKAFITFMIDTQFLLVSFKVLPKEIQTPKQWLTGYVCVDASVHFFFFFLFCKLLYICMCNSSTNLFFFALRPIPTLNSWRDYSETISFLSTGTYFLVSCPMLGDWFTYLHPIEGSLLII